MTVLLMLTGCLVTAELVDPDTLPNSDTDANPSDTEVGSDGVGDDTEEDTEDTEADVVDPADFLVWRGSRFFDFGADICQDEVSEVGVNVLGESGFEELADACPRCDAIFTLSASPDAICSGTVGINTEPIRGLAVGSDGDIVIYAITEDYYGYDSYELAEGSLDGMKLEYDYESEYYGYDYEVTGTVEFE